MLELLGAKAAVCTGRLHYGTAFGEGAGLADNATAISETLARPALPARTAGLRRPAPEPGRAALHGVCIESPRLHGNGLHAGGDGVFCRLGARGVRRGLNNNDSSSGRDRGASGARV